MAPSSSHALFLCSHVRSIDRQSVGATPSPAHVVLSRPAAAASLTHKHALWTKELNKMLKVDSYWGASAGTAADVVKTDKKTDKKKPAAKGVKVGAKKGKAAKGGKSKDPKVLKAQQAARKLLAAKQVWVAFALAYRASAPA